MLETVTILSQTPGTDFQQPFSFKGGDREFPLISVEGLGPVAAEIVTSPRPFTGVNFDSAKINSRNVVLTIGLRPDYASGSKAMSLRRYLYGGMAPGNNVSIMLEGDGLYQGFDTEGFLQGVVESFEPNIFSKDPEVQISIICPEPYIVGGSDQVKVLKPGSGDFYYTGTAPAPFISAQWFSGTLLNASVHVSRTPNMWETASYMGVFSTTPVNFESGDYLVMSSYPENPYSRHERGQGGPIVASQGYFRSTIPRPVLRLGTNYFSFSENYVSRAEIEYRNHYLGI